MAVLSSTCEVKNGIAIIRVAPGDFGRLADTVRVASQDGAFSQRVRLLIDLRIPLRDLNYEDLRAQALALARMHAVLAPQWAVVAGSAPTAANAAFIFATIAGGEHVTAQVFDDEGKALRWLRQWEAL
jgi:hypothetical protein